MRRNPKPRPKPNPSSADVCVYYCRTYYMFGVFVCVYQYPHTKPSLLQSVSLCSRDNGGGDRVVMRSPCRGRLPRPPVMDRSS